MLCWQPRLVREGRRSTKRNAVVDSYPSLSLASAIRVPVDVHEMKFNDLPGASVTSVRGLAAGGERSRPNSGMKSDASYRQVRLSLRSSGKEPPEGKDAVERARGEPGGLGKSDVSDAEDRSGLPRVLVVDDAVSNRKMLCRLLRSRCRSVTEAGDGQEALHKVLESLSAPPDLQYDIVLMDFVMPVMDGPTATSEIRKAGFTGVVIGLTGNVLESDMDFFRSHGANSVLTKPFDVKAYDEAVAELKRSGKLFINANEYTSVKAHEGVLTAIRSGPAWEAASEEVG